MQHTGSVSFTNTDREFVTRLNQRVNEYFRDNNLNRHGNLEMVVKTFFMFSLYFLPYALILNGIISGTWPLLLAVVIMGFGLAGIGLSVMHDANHGAYSDKSWVNQLIGYSLNLLGATCFTWKIQHNVLHHSFTNIHEEDEDISPRGVLRLSPHSPWKAMHRYQYLYAWFLYGLMTLVWILVKDFDRLIKYNRRGLVKKQKASIIAEWFILLTTKAAYIGYSVLIPLWLTPLSIWQILLGLVIMHYIAGFVLAVIFQPAHVVEGTEYPLPDATNSMSTNWAIHQLHTTTNFGNRSRWFSWYVGGLNFQIEHHLFPNICHVHYRKLAPIVQETTREFGLPYKSAKTFVGALAGHARLLRNLGVQPAGLNR